MPNRLIHETSPYLQQHAHNPVDWYPWGEEALTKARTENKPILVSIGYSACHWCHVMERESFEKEQVAEVMNADFVCIKVDREERPDVDAIYMDSLQAMGTRGGWPLNVFLMPDAKPFYGVTYLPAQNWVQLLRSVKNAFENHHDDLVKSAEGFTSNMLIKESEKYDLYPGQERGEAVPSIDDLHEMFEKMKQHFDTEKGGMDRAPKFPMPSIYKFLLRYYALTQNPEALRHIELSLNRIALGGIYDHVGGGWARYSVDDEWFIPHFEKMLYDNGQLLSIYSEAYTLTKNELYKSRVYETIDWLEREMASAEGGFYSALDADSEGVEGKFYIWTQSELKLILGDDFEWFSKLYNIRASGNWEHGYNHLHLVTLFPRGIPSNPSPSEGKGVTLSPSLIGSDRRTEGWGGIQYKNALQKLFIARESRIRPGLDDKILASWNGLMLKGLTDAYRAFGEEKFKTLALNNARFLKEKMTSNQQLWHNYKNGKATIVGFLEDYATVVDAYIGLYQATFQEEWLDEALKLTAYVVENFYDAEDELFYFTDSNAEDLIARKKEVFDNVIPASNSLMAQNLYWLGTIFDHGDYVKLADWMLLKMKRALLTDVQWVTNWAALYALRTQPTAEIAIVGKEADALRKELESRFVPNKIVVGTQTRSDLPLLQERTAKNDLTTIYVCFNKTCNLPVHTINDVWTQLNTLNG
ncbi:thioredoxin domain-containing protein [Runella sp.]|uniref:thioredoxin domain-containing protein n=1 Tax=Runella sp. TaxID=1960881 RepID=UPI0026260EFD|nr:thioredoxin domain-containing protein [Runella sp.]